MANGSDDDSGTVLRFPSNGRRVDGDGDAGTDTGVETVEPPLRSVVGDVLRAERLSQDRTLADVAERAAVSLPYLSEVERGRKEVSSDVLAAVCDGLELPLVEVLERCVDRMRDSETSADVGLRSELRLGSDVRMRSDLTFQLRAA